MPMIKDPTYNIYASGGNVENRKNTPKKDDLIKLAKDEADLIFDFENEIIDVLTQEYNKEKTEGQSFLDWLDTKPRNYFLKIPLFLALLFLARKANLKQSTKFCS